MSVLPFVVHIPAAPGPVVVEVPHAGLDVMDGSPVERTRVPPNVVASDADIGAKALFAVAVDEGAVFIEANTSRFVIDLNTFPRVPTPYEDKLPYGLREVRRTSAHGEHWYECRPPGAVVERRIRELFEPYHAEIAARLEAARVCHGIAVLVSGHSYPDRLFPRAADVVIGTRGGESADSPVRDAVAEVARAHGLSVAVDDPFRGGYALERHGHLANGVRAVQIEVARRLFCDPHALVPRPDDITRLRGCIQQMISALTKVATEHRTAVDDGPGSC